MNQAILSAHAEFVDPAVREMRALAPEVRLLGSIAPGVCLLGLPAPFAELAPRWRAEPPCFVRHLCPVDAVRLLDGTKADIDTLRRAVRDELADLIATSATFSVQTRILDEGFEYKPFAVNSALAKAIAAETGASLNVRQPSQVVSVVIGRWRGDRAAWLGVSRAVDNLSDWAGGERRFRREPDQVSRSEFKLLEALEWFQLKFPATGRVLDLGAAPGGWTRLVRQKTENAVVVAVDPAELAPAVRSDWGVWVAGEAAETYLAQQPPKPQFDVILNDMHVEAAYSVHVMLMTARLLKPNGWALMTLELPEGAEEETLRQALGRLGQRYRVIGARHLFHNRRDVTIALRAAPQSSPAR